jgi:hypothetical protein
MNIKVQEKVENFLAEWLLLAFQEDPVELLELYF